MHICIHNRFSREYNILSQFMRNSLLFVIFNNCCTSKEEESNKEKKIYELITDLIALLSLR